jgi:hypothetical protein
MSNYPQPPAPNWASGHDRPNQTSWIAPMIVGAIIFATGCGGGLVAGWFAGVANSFGDMFDTAPFDATVQIDAPTQVRPDQIFDIVVRITDTSGVGRTVRDIDFDTGLTTALEVISIEPAPADIYIDPDYREHSFDRPLAANQTGIYTFTVRPKDDSFIEGSVSIYLDDYSSESQFITINVGSPPAGAAIGQTEPNTNQRPDPQPEPETPED